MVTVSHQSPSYNSTPGRITPIRSVREDDAEYETVPDDAFAVVVPVDVTRTILGTLGPNCYAIYALLETYCDANGQAYPSVETIAQGTQLVQKTIKNLMPKLVEAGWVERTERFNRFGVHAGYTYTLPHHRKPRTNEGVSEWKDDGKRVENGVSSFTPEVSTKVIPKVTTKVDGDAPAREGEPAPRRQRRGRTPGVETLVPDDFAVSDAMRQKAIGYGVHPSQIDYETERFCNWYRSKGIVRIDWVATWRQWMMSAPQKSNAHLPRPDLTSVDTRHWTEKIADPNHKPVDMPPPPKWASPFGDDDEVSF